MSYEAWKLQHGISIIQALVYHVHITWEGCLVGFTSLVCVCVWNKDSTICHFRSIHWFQISFLLRVFCIIYMRKRMCMYIYAFIINAQIAGVNILTMRLFLLLEIAFS